MTTEWTELSYLQKVAGKVEEFRDLRQNPLSTFVLGSVLVFFVLAGPYVWVGRSRWRSSWLCRCACAAL
jgi:hypothetical protein